MPRQFMLIGPGQSCVQLVDPHWFAVTLTQPAVCEQRQHQPSSHCPIAVAFRLPQSVRMRQSTKTFFIY